MEQGLSLKCEQILAPGKVSHIFFKSPVTIKVAEERQFVGDEAFCNKE